MSFIGLFLLAVALSADAFAASVCAGVTMKNAGAGRFLSVGLYFGVFQAVMPLIGYMAAARFAGMITAYDHWIVFVLLSFLGGKMIAGGFSGKECSVSLKPSRMLALALATSVDALAAGISLAFLRVDIVPAVLLIGITTFALSAAGVKIGGVFGIRFRSKAEIAGGVILILIGLKILLEHTWFVVL